ncbi:MAG: hypothetical protein AAFP19_13900 [Bacteroidota bacterium]
MDLREELLREHSKAQALRLSEYIGHDADRLADLMALFLRDEYRVSQRAAWVVSHCAKRSPELFKPYFQVMLENLERGGQHIAIKRNTLKVLAELGVPNELLGMAASLCFDYLADPKEAIAVKAHSMAILYQICLVEPDLAGELQLLIEDQLPTGSAGIKSRGKNILKALRKRGLIT